MLDLIKLYSVIFMRTLIFKLQLLIRFVLNGRCYPTREQRENGEFKDYWIGWIAYKYFSKLTIFNGWLKKEFYGPFNHLIYVETSHGYGMTKDLNEIKDRILNFPKQL